MLYTGSIDNITGTVRLRHWRAGEVPRHDVEELSMDRFPDFAERNTGEIERLMVRRSMRGKLAVAALVRASYDLFAGEQETDLVFCYCSPGLVRYYQHLAMRPFGGRLVHAPDGLMLPLVSVLSDRDYYRRSGSLLATQVRRHFGPGKRTPLDISPYLHLFVPGENGIEFEAERVWETVEEALLNEAGTLMTRKGFGEQEIYIVLDGLFEATDDSRHLGHMGRGEVFGEDAFLHPEGRRVSALEDGRVLVLRGRAVEKLIRRQPALAMPLVRELTGVLTRRLAVPPVAAAA